LGKVEEFEVRGLNHNVLKSMIKRLMSRIFIIVLTFLFFFQCTRPDEPRFSFSDKGRIAPEFSSGQAYEYIRTQVEFGPRNPNSPGHRQTRDFLYRELQQFAGERNVFLQSFEHEGYEGEILQLHNIIAAFNLQSSDRIVLAAHWDTRPRAEEDPDRPDDPIPGANDGGSGVGVLLELARIMSENPPPIGVDIIFFDGEDYGETGDLQNYFLGARYWGNNPPVPGYNPRFGILLDMVGGEGAVFPKEGYSIRFAPSLVDAIWDVAAELGYEELFPDREGALVSDDHVIVERTTGIPMINIIHHERSEQGGALFPPYWHTHQDNMDIIDRDVLQAVGDLMVELIYNRI
jgi:glutaminyl-peptide cyclotransferase